MGLVVLTGASGAGKTTIAEAFAATHSAIAEVCHFDRIHVPSIQRMTEEYGSPDEWQRIATVNWLRELAQRLRRRSNILFEGQARVSFIREAATDAAIPDVQIILIDCEDAIRTERLNLNRHQPELANQRMMDWARFLREQARHQGVPILDRTDLAIEESVGVVRSYFD